MSKILWHTTMSLDGFISGPDDAMDWASGHGEHSHIADDTMNGIGVVLGGRNWYDVAVSKYDGVDGVYGGEWSGPVFVLTHNPPPGEHDPRVTFLSGGIEEAVATAREAAKGQSVVIFGANTARQCLAAGLMDEIVVHIAPVLLGEGVRLYGEPGSERIQLERTEVDHVGQTTDLVFRVKR